MPDEATICKIPIFWLGVDAPLVRMGNVADGRIEAPIYVAHIHKPHLWDPLRLKDFKGTSCEAPSVALPLPSKESKDMRLSVGV